MNIFVVDRDPIIAARQLCDKHVVKMTLETTQLLCTVSWKFDVPAPYKQTHKNHPCTLWAGETVDNWKWLVDHGLELSEEYSRRYGKVHACKSKLEWCLESGGRPKLGGLKPFAQAMPDEFRDKDAVEAYRKYYIGAKAAIAKWKFSDAPEWFIKKE